MFVLPLLVSVLVQPALIVSTCLQLSLSHPHCLWQDHVVVYLLPPADVVQHGLVHPIVHHQVPHHAAAHLTPAHIMTWIVTSVPLLIIYLTTSSICRWLSIKHCLLFT